MLHASRTVQGHIARGRALVIGSLRQNAVHRLLVGQPAKLLKASDAHAERRRHAHDNVKVSTLAGLDQQRDIVHHDLDTLTACLTVSRARRRTDIRMDDLFEAHSRLIVSEDDVGQERSVEHPTLDDAVAKLTHNVDESSRPWLHDATREVVVINDACPEFSESLRRRGLTCSDSARQPNA